MASDAPTWKYDETVSVCVCVCGILVPEIELLCSLVLTRLKEDPELILVLLRGDVSVPLSFELCIKDLVLVDLLAELGRRSLLTPHASR